MYPGKTKYFLESYQDAVSEAHGYLLVDCTADAVDANRLVFHVFPGEYPVVYVEK
jgi:hypothetical protein